MTWGRGCNAALRAKGGLEQERYRLQDARKRRDDLVQDLALYPPTAEDVAFNLEKGIEIDQTYRMTVSE